MTAKTNDSFRDCGKELVKVTKSGVCVRVFRATRKGVKSFVIAYYLNGQRMRETFRGDLEAYRAAVEQLKPFRVPLAVAVQEYVAARQRIGGHSLAEAADHFAATASLDLPKRTLADVAQEMLNAKAADGIGTLYRKQLRCLLEPACNAITKPISEITTSEIDDYLRGLAVSTRSRYNVRAVLVSAFEFAKSRGYLPQDRETVAARAVRVRVKTGEVEIFTPAEMSALLKAADADTLPLLALGGFAGLRTAEIGRLQWKDIDLIHGLITVSAAKAKTASRRIIPIQQNLSRWLQPWANASGPVFRPKDATKEQKKVSKAAGVAWKHNALRHSFGSYRLADIKNAAEVALEMGNSPQMIFQHYRELVKPADAKAWWAISPEQPANVVTMTAAKAEAG
ncbi:MAG: tyrosine-type recombinase/integrase [Verrucomicrobia bacterium]|nr:tyrosine-type recombinase/integrase [Verrucomicrobiota bacterium]